MLKILLVDDEYHVLNHITTLLQQLRCCEINILQATSGTRALEIAASSHIDMAFLDINMPKVSGLQIADKLHHQWPDCRIIFLTAYEVFDYIYEANQYPNATYLLKSESDARILEVVESCCQTLLQKRQEELWLSDVQKKEKLLLLLQEQQLLREIIHGNLAGNWETFVKNASLDIHLSFDRGIYLMLMHVKRAPSSSWDASFYLEKMDHLLGNLFLFSFAETEKGMFLWIFQEKETPEKDFIYFDCLKDTMDTFLNICTESKHQTLSLCLLGEKTGWEQLALSYQFLYSAYYADCSMVSGSASTVRVLVRRSPHGTNANTNASVDADLNAAANAIKDTWNWQQSYQIAQQTAGQRTAAQSQRLSSMKQSLYQGNRDLFLTDLQYCRQYCTGVRSMHHVGAIKLYYSIVLIYLDYIDHYSLEPRVAMEIALYPLYYLNDFPDWEYAFRYLNRLGEILFRIANESNSHRTRQLIASIQNYVQAHLSEDLNLTVIANYANYNESHISRLFKRHTGSNLSEYITSCRIEYAKRLLAQTEDTVQAISQKAGFHTSQYFSSTFRKSTGMSPQEYRLRKPGTP